MLRLIFGDGLFLLLLNWFFSIESTFTLGVLKILVLILLVFRFLFDG